MIDGKFDGLNGIYIYQYYMRDGKYYRSENINVYVGAYTCDILEVAMSRIRHEVDEDARS